MNVLAKALFFPQEIQYAPGFLLGGGSPTASGGTWTAVSDGEFTISIDGTEYEVTGIDFTSGATTAALIAGKIQAALRTATGGLEEVYWDAAAGVFMIYSADVTVNSAVSKASAVSGGAGTDISGEGTAFMDCDAGATGEVVTAANLKYDNVQADGYHTLGDVFTISHAEELSLKLSHIATVIGQTLSTRVEVSDDGIGVSEANSRWYSIGVQESAGGTPSVLTGEDWEYKHTSLTTDEEYIVPLRYDVMGSQKARLRVKGSDNLGYVRASVGIVPIS